jgi:hypothetical protein
MLNPDLKKLSIKITTERLLVADPRSVKINATCEQYVVASVAALFYHNVTQ